MLPALVIRGTFAVPLLPRLRLRPTGKPKECDVVLTKFMMVRRDTLSLFFDYAEVLGLPLGLVGTHTRWNGEDIFMSLVHKAASGNLNYAMPKESLIDVVEVESASSPAISGGVPKDVTAILHPVGIFKGVGHIWHRMKMWSLAEDRLASIASLVTPTHLK